MSKTAATKTPTRVNGGDQTNTDASNAAIQQFISAVLSMSWQLALVVLIPIIGGFKLDQHLKTTPLWTIVGFVLAIIAGAVVVQRTIKDITPPNKEKSS